MAIPSTVSGISFSTPTCVGAWIEYPFRNQGDSATKIYVHQMQVLNTDYTPLSDNDTMTAATQKPIRSPFADDAAAYYVGDSQPSPTDGGLVQFNRTFANIPASRIDPMGIYAYERPGFDQAISFGNYKCTWLTGDSTAKSFTNTPSPQITITIPATPDRREYFNAAAVSPFTNLVQIYNPSQWNCTMPWGSLVTNYLVGSISSRTDYTITLETLLGADDNIATQLVAVTSVDSDNSATHYNLGLVPEEASSTFVNAPAFVSVSYVKTITPENESLSGRQEFLNNNADVVTQLNDSSFPTVTEYLNDLESETLQQLENETITRWKGNIYEKRKILGKVPLHRLKV